LNQALREEVATKSDLAAVKTELAANIAPDRGADQVPAALERYRQIVSVDHVSGHVERRGDDITRHWHYLDDGAGAADRGCRHAAAGEARRRSQDQKSSETTDHAGSFSG